MKFYAGEILVCLLYLHQYGRGPSLGVSVFDVSSTDSGSIGLKKGTRIRCGVHSSTLSSCYVLLNMGEWPHPFCALCGTLILNGGSLDPEPNIWDRSAWLHNAFAIEGPECLGEPMESSSHPDELFTWHEATGHTDYEFGWGHLTLLPTGTTVFPHSAHGNRDLAYVESGHVYLGFHRACASIARQFVRRTKGYPVKSFADIWITLNGRYSKGPGGCGGDYAPQIPVKTERGTYIWTKEATYYLGYSHGIEWVSIYSHCLFF